MLRFWRCQFPAYFLTIKDVYRFIIVFNGKILSLLKYLYSLAEFTDRDACALSRELFGCSLKEEDDWAKEDQSAGNSGSDLKPSSALSTDRKILLQRHSILDRQMVSVHQSKVSIHFIFSPVR